MLQRQPSDCPSNRCERGPAGLFSSTHRLLPCCGIFQHRPLNAQTSGKILLPRWLVPYQHAHAQPPCPSCRKPPTHHCHFHSKNLECRKLPHACKGEGCWLLL